MIEKFRKIPTKVKVAMVILFILWLSLFSMMPPLALMIAGFFALMWSAFVVINYLTDL